jgi:hypothetical protein
VTVGRRNRAFEAPGIIDAFTDPRLPIPGCRSAQGIALVCSLPVRNVTSQVQARRGIAK